MMDSNALIQRTMQDVAAARSEAERSAILTRFVEASRVADAGARAAAEAEKAHASVSLHEAGHAVACCVLGVRFDHVDMVPRDGRLGAVYGSTPSPSRLPREEALAHLKAALAGKVADRLWGRERTGHSSDTACARVLAGHIAEAVGRDRDLILWAAECQTEDLLQKHARSVHAVAAELRRCERLEEAEVAFIIEFPRGVAGRVS